MVGTPLDDFKARILYVLVDRKKSGVGTGMTARELRNALKSKDDKPPALSKVKRALKELADKRGLLEAAAMAREESAPGPLPKGYFIAAASKTITLRTSAAI